MKTISFNIGAWWTAKREQLKKHSAQRKYERLVAEAERTIQVREYDGKVWFAVNGLPLLEASDLTLDFANTIAHAREALVSYQQNERTPDNLIPTYHGDR